MYQDHFSSFSSSFAGIVGAVAQDLARLLDEPLFAVTSSNAYEMVPLRETAYNRFCAACEASSVPLPPLEKEVLEYYLPKKQEARNKDQVEANLKLAGEIYERTDDKLCRAVALVLETFPATGAGSFDGISKKNLMAVVNRALLNLGKEPFRFLPELRLPPEDLVPERELSVLIVDDKAEDIFKTALALAGWPKLKVFWEHQDTKMSFDPTDEQKEQELDRLCKAILARQPDIILMDQGLRGVNGSDLVPHVLKGLPPVVIIANTGGGTDELHAAGAISSASKGEKMERAMREAMQYIGN